MGLVAGALSILSGCGSDSTAPNHGATSGHWVYSANLSGEFATCTATGIDLNLTQTGDTVAGTYANGRFTCFGAGPFPTPQGTVVNGSAVGPAVAFALTSASGAPVTISNTGSATLNSMSGDAMVSVPIYTGEMTLTGTW
jgi:FlaG/FlaF family flagellin (archaellin)